VLRVPHHTFKRIHFMSDSYEPGISVCFVIKNGIRQGYPFWESLKSCLSFADEVVISDGYSDDGTLDVLKKFIEMHEDQAKFRLYLDDWNMHRSGCGEVIAAMSAINFRRCEREWVYYLQADEVLHEENSDFVRDIADNHSEEFNSVIFRFAHFIHAWEPLPPGQAYDEAIRMVKNDRRIKFLGDAWTFTGAIAPTCPAGLGPKPIYHLGWVFPKNCDVKSIEHAKLYAGRRDYQASAKRAKQNLAADQYATGFDANGTFSDYPAGVERLIGMVEYKLPAEALP